jgi:CubicO group peptidase (beta-lactamase class C family)
VGNTFNMNGSGFSSAIELVAEQTNFSGSVRVDVEGATVVALVRGDADRRCAMPITPATRIGIASGTKGFTALTVMALVERGDLALDTTARSLLGVELPMIDGAVTVEQLLAHRSGIGDYLDEDELDDIGNHIMSLPVHCYLTTDGYVPSLDGHPQTSPPGDRFAYNNSGYVVLALLVERATGAPFHDLVDELVCRPAGLTHTAFLRSDELPPDAAIGYLGDGLRTNVLHLPVRGSGDGGISTTADDVHRLWEALADGRVVERPTLAAMTRPRSTIPDGERRYGLGFWLHGTTDAVILEGYDAGASFRSVHQPSRGITVSVLSNTSDGAWPVARRVAELLDL